MSEGHSHNKYPRIPEFSRDDAHDIVEELSSLPSAKTFDDMFGLETVNELGEVDLTRAVTAEASPGDTLKTVVGKLPLVSYLDNGIRHDITLYSRRVSGFYNEVGSDTDESLFVVDQGTDTDGTTFLAATPGRLSRTRDPRETRPDDSQLTLALLQGANGAEGIKQLLDARESGDENKANRVASDIEAALRKRGPERVSQADFTEWSWADKGIITPSVDARRRAQVEVLHERQEKEWQRTSPIKKLGARVLSMVNRKRYETPKDAYLALQRRKERIKREWNE